MTQEHKTMYLYTIHDKAAKEYGPLFEAVNSAVAHRQYKQLINNLPFSEDYTLYCVGMVTRIDDVIQFDVQVPEKVNMPEELVV